MKLDRRSFLIRLEQEKVRCSAPLRLRYDSFTWISGMLSLLFPHFQQQFGHSVRPAVEVADELDLVLLRMLNDAGIGQVLSHEILEKFWNQVPDVHTTLLADARATDEFDPASESVDEVILAYPGFYAIAIYRLAHILYGQGVPFLPRILTEHAHRETGIEIHPGAEIDSPFVIDHGTGIVIGQSAKIGKRVKLYHGVTIGALAVKKHLAKTKRHPTIEDDVIIYSGATILGGETVIGAGSVVGGNAWITSSVPARSIIVDEPITTVSSRKK